MQVLPTLKYKHCYCKEALKNFGKIYPSRVGSSLPSIFYNSASLSLRVVLHHYKLCSRKDEKWQTVCRKYKGNTEELDRVKSILECIVDPDDDDDDDDDDEEDGDMNDVYPEVPKPKNENEAQISEPMHVKEAKIEPKYGKEAKIPETKNVKEAKIPEPKYVQEAKIPEPKNVKEIPEPKNVKEAKNVKEIPEPKKVKEAKHVKEAKITEPKNVIAKVVIDNDDDEVDWMALQDAAPKHDLWQV